MASLNATVATDCPATLAPYADVTRLAALVVFAFTTLYLPATIGWWWVRRKHTMLQKRSFLLMVLTAIGIYFHVLTVGLVDYKGPDWLPCDVHAWTAHPSLAMMAGPILARLLLFYNRHRLSVMLTLEAENNRARLQSIRGRFGRKSFCDAVATLARWSCRCCSFSSKPSAGGKGGKLKLALAGPSSDSSVSFDEMSDGGSTATYISSLQDARLYALFFLSQKMVFSMCLVVFFLSIALATVIAQYMPEDSPYGGKGCKGCTLDLADILAVVTILVIFVIVAVYVMYKLRVNKTPDPFGIQAELVWVLRLGGLSVLVTVLAVVDPAGIDSEQRLVDWFLLSNLVALGIHTVQCPLAVLQTYDRSEVPSGDSDQESWTLTEVLANSSARAVLAEYLAGEFSMENIMFYEAVVDYQQRQGALSEARQRSMAQNLMNNFITEGCMLQINISAQTRRKIQEQIAQAEREQTKVPFDVFAGAKREIVGLMESDTFPRFQRSALFKELDADAERGV